MQEHHILVKMLNVLLVINYMQPKEVSQEMEEVLVVRKGNVDLMEDLDLAGLVQKDG